MFIKNKNVASTIEKINKKEIYEFIKQFQANKLIMTNMWKMLFKLIGIFKM